MDCPHCKKWNTPGLEFCEFCRGPLFSVWLPPSSKLPVPKPPPPKPRVDFGRVFRPIGTWLHTHYPLLLILLGVFTITAGAAYYLSPLTRLKLYGVRLDYQGTRKGPTQYLVAFHSDVDSWTERENHLDTPLFKRKVDELGTVLVQRTPGPATHGQATVRTMEWIQIAKTGDTNINKSIPPGHPSIAQAAVALDRQGSLVDRPNTPSLRMGRALQYLFPRFPKGIQRPGSSWTESIIWVEMISEWKIRWQAELRWTLQGFEKRGGAWCVTLAYDGQLVPELQETPAWAKGAAGTVLFSGKGVGEALYLPQEKRLISNTFSYSGNLEIPITSLELIPWEERVGVPLSAGPGVVILRFANKTDIRQP
jgi:hypothetical protein